MLAENERGVPACDTAVSLVDTGAGLAWRGYAGEKSVAMRQVQANAL